MQTPSVADADLCHVRMTYCRALSATGNLSQVTRVHAHALSLSRSSYGNCHPRTLRDMQLLAEAFHAVGDLDAAAALYAEAAAALKESLGRFHPSTAHVVQQHAAVCCQLGDYTLAEELCEEAVSCYRQVIGGAWVQRQHWHNLVHCLRMLTDLRTRAGRLKDAEALLRDAIDCSRNKALPRCSPGAVGVCDEGSISLAALTLSLARVLAKRRRFDEALQLLAAVQQARTGSDGDGRSTGRLREGVQLQRCVGAVLQGAGRYLQANEAYGELQLLAVGASNDNVADDYTCEDNAAAAAADDWAILSQQEIQLHFAQHCHALFLFLRAAASCSSLAPQFIQHHLLHPPPQRALHIMQQLWRQNHRHADRLTPLAQRRRLLCFAPAATAAIRLVAHMHGGAPVLAAAVVRRCLGWQGAHRVLVTCTPPPEFDCA